MKTFKQFMCELDTSKMPRADDSDIVDYRGADAAAKKKQTSDDWLKRTMDAINKVPNSNEDPEGYKKYADSVERNKWMKNDKIQSDPQGNPRLPDVKLGQNRRPSVTTNNTPAPAPKAQPAPAPVPKTEPIPAPAPKPVENRPIERTSEPSSRYTTSIRPNNPLPSNEKGTRPSDAELDQLFKESLVSKVVKALDEMDLSREKPDYSNIEDRREQLPNVKYGTKWITTDPTAPGKPLTKAEVIAANSPKSEYEDLTKK